MENIAQIIAYGVITGAVYGLVAMGLGLIMGVMKFLNIAHGSFIVLSGYIAFWLLKLWGIDPYLSIPLVLIAMFAIGLLFYKLALSPLLKLPSVGARMDLSMLITFGLIYIMDNTMAMVWTPNIRSAVTSYTGESVNLLGARFSITGLYGLGIAVLTAVVLYLLLSKTYFGKHVRAATQDAQAASLCGVNVHRTYLISCGIAIALAGVAGVIIVTSYSINPTGGLSWLLIALVVMILAGEGNMYGILPAGIIVGLIESVSVLTVGIAFRQAAALIIFILILMFRPQGLFSRGE